MVSQSQKFYRQASRFLVGGVNSPVRSFKSVGGDPLFFKKGQGPYLFDEDDKKYIDFVLSWGPLILGHCHPQVSADVKETLEQGWSFGAPHRLEVELAQEIVKRYPKIGKIRFVSSGTEATLSALRLARGVTKRDHIVKFSGCYHGHVDSLLVEAGSGLVTHGQPTSAGIPSHIVQTTHVLNFNDHDGVTKCFEEYGDDIAAVIVEGVPGNMGVVIPDPKFVQTLNHTVQHYGALLILDEVLTGFRVRYKGGVEAQFGYQADITTFGKVIGGGFPVGAYAANDELMSHLSPLGDVYQAGTLSGNPVAMAAGLSTLRCLDDEVYKDLEKKGAFFAERLQEVFLKHHIYCQTSHVGSIVGMHLTKNLVTNFSQAQETNEIMYRQLFHSCLDQGVYLPPSPYEAFFLSTQHDERVLNEALEKIDQALGQFHHATA